MVLSPAKINVGLNIPYKREDGYHEIRSFFIPLQWGDEMQVLVKPSPWVRHEFRLHSQIQLPSEKVALFERVSEKGDITKNILYKAFVAISPFFREPYEIDIHLTKRIPPEGGVGGGSSNAGTFLKEILPFTTLESTALPSLAKSLGADVPFFLKSEPCFVTGIGEKLDPISVAPGAGVLAIPPTSLSTREMFLALQKDLQQTPGFEPWKSLEEKAVGFLRTGNWVGLRELLQNDFETVAFARAPLLESIKISMLQEGGQFASLSGSGSCVYALVEDREDASQLESTLASQYPHVGFRTFTF